MPEITLYNKEGNEIGPLSLPESIFGVLPNVALIHQAVTTEEANMRQGTSSTKTRGNVRGGGRKPWKQKGTGRARQGSTRSPQWRHGGVVFGPHPRSYSKQLPQKMRIGAIRAALSSKVRDGEMLGLNELAVENVKTKEIAAMLKALPLTRELKTRHWDGGAEKIIGTKSVRYQVLLIIPEYDEQLLLSCRNIPNLTLRYAPNFSVRDVMSAGRIILAQGAVTRIEEVLAK